MSVALYMDVHVPQAITDQLRQRGVDVVTAAEDDHTEVPDEALLTRAHQLGRVLFTQDILFKALAEEWQRAVNSSKIRPRSVRPAKRYLSTT